MNFEKLYKLYLKLNSLSIQSGSVEQNINKEVEKQKIEKIFDSEWFSDGCHAYASNGEFSFDYEEFKEAINKTLKGERFYLKGSDSKSKEKVE